MRTIDNNENTIFVADEEYARWSQIFDRERVGEIVRNSNAALYTDRIGMEMFNRILSEGVSAFSLTEARGNTEVDSERYRWFFNRPATSDQCYSRNENIPTWNGKVLEKVEVFQ